MVDVRSALRPLVEEPARDRLPVAELAERATRARTRRLRRRSAVAGVAAVVVVAVGGSLMTRDDPDQVTTRGTDPATPSTTAPAPSTTAAPPGTEPGATTPSTTATGPPTPPPTTTPPRPTTTTAPGPTGPGAEAPVGNDPALVVTRSTTSDWENGHCVEHRVENTGDAPVTWTVELTPAGEIDTLWNARIVAEDGPRRTFAGEDWNATVAPGAWTTFGTCLAT